MYKVVILAISTITLYIVVFMNIAGVMFHLLNFVSSIFFLLTLYIIIPNKENEYLSFISSVSFGVYLFHSPLCYITYTFIPNVNPLLVIFLNFIVFGLISILLTMFIKKTKLKVIIGE